LLPYSAIALLAQAPADHGVGIVDFSFIGSALDGEHVWVVPAWRFSIGKSESRRLVEKPDENTNQCQAVAFGSMPGEDFEQFDLCILSINGQDTKIQ
jgi:hypothetical protein